MANRAPRTSRSRPRSSTKWGALLGLWLAGGAAEAATPDRCQADHACREQVEQAAQLAAQTNYEDSLKRYENAYERVPEPRLLINIGRCHYRLGRARKALDFYESFQKAGIDVEPELMARVGQFIAEAKLAIVSDTVKAMEKPADKPAELPVVTPPPPVVMQQPANADAQDAPRQGRPIWRIAVGASALGVGALFLGLGAGALSADGKCVTPDPMMPDLCATMTAADGSRSTRFIDGKATGIGLLISGSLIAVGGAVLIALPGRRTKNIAMRRTVDANAFRPGFFALRVPAFAADGSSVR